jgi:hypothetical protein
LRDREADIDVRGDAAEGFADVADLKHGGD